MPTPIGLVGLGKHGERYLRHVVEDVPELRVALVSRRDAEAGRRQADAAGARYVADARDLVVSPEIEAVVLVVPPVCNVELASLAARAGKALLVEKPLAVTVEAAAAVHAAVRRAGVPAMVAQTLRFNRVVQLLLAELDDIGPVHQIALSQRFEPSPLRWLDDPAESGGGMILHTGVHSFDLVRLFADREPTRAAAFATSVATSRTEDDFVASFAFDGSPLTATVSGSRATASRSGAIEISGSKGQLVGDHHHRFAFRIAGSRRIDLHAGKDVPTVRETLRAFARALRDGTPMPVPLEDGLRAVAMAEACYRSVASGKSEPVSVPAT